MAGPVEGYNVPLHQSLTHALLLGGAPRSLAIINGTVAAALGLGLQMWVAGLIFWMVGHSLAVFAAKHDPDFLTVLMRHLRQKAYLTC
jgi:type IV secretion system protein VirB3